MEAGGSEARTGWGQTPRGPTRRWEGKLGSGEGSSLPVTSDPEAGAVGQWGWRKLVFNSILESWGGFWEQRGLTEAGGGEGVQKEGEGELGPWAIHFNSHAFIYL